jgi:NADPH:quinone reductase-like Zn-dependent oxidoreductase
MLGSKPQQQDLQILRDYIDARKITAVIDRTFPLTEVPEAIRYLVEGHRGGGKIVITV